MVRVAIIGATGYTALESIKILLRHRQVKLTYLTALPEECGPIEQVFPRLRGRLALAVEPLELSKAAALADVVLCCLPHKVSMECVPHLLQAGLKVVDFSADYRLRDVGVYEKFYQVPHTDRRNLVEAAYGLPELFREQIRPKRLVANPGCYPTCAVLGLAPLVRERLIRTDGIIVSAITGVSGAGRKPSLAYHYPEINENGFAYGVGSHRHMPEMEQVLSDVAGGPVSVVFQPHVVSLTRGMLASMYAEPARSISQAELDALYHESFDAEPFVRLPGRPPQMAAVADTNFCDVYATVVKGRVVVFSALDNLVKGAAGQAVQNLNLVCGFDETTGLL
jgi:N-acetyl-gamma-glutamyl-phosphate reductase